MQDFFERVAGKSVNEAVFINLIICDAFKKIEPVKSNKELITEYFYLKKVTSLSIGKDKIEIGRDDKKKPIYDSTPKKGASLLKAIEEFKAKENISGNRIDIPKWDTLTTEITKARILPIYRLNVHDKFQRLLEQKGIMYQDDTANLRMGMVSMPALINMTDIKRRVTGHKEDRYIWTGVVNSSETFQYTDKKTKKKVTALKTFVSNADDSLECIMWPNTYEILKDPDTTKIIMFMGNIRESREQGKYTMTVEEMIYI